MMAKTAERVLLLQCQEEQIHTAKNGVRELGILILTLSREAWREKVGWMLGLKGYKPAFPSPADEPFEFPHRLLLLEHIQGKRMTKVLMALEDAGIPRITYKSAITPYNTMWTLRYLCEHMEKEHAPTVEDREGKV